MLYTENLYVCILYFIFTGDKFYYTGLKKNFKRIVIIKQNEKNLNIKAAHTKVSTPDKCEHYGKIIILLFSINI